MKKRSFGFSLVELMITVAIIGILAAIAIPAFDDYRRKAKISEGITLLSQLHKELLVEWSINSEIPEEVHGMGKNEFVEIDTPTSNVRRLHYNYQPASNTAWVAVQLSEELIGEDVKFDEGYVHMGTRMKDDGNFITMCGLWNVYATGLIDPAVLPQGCNEEEIGAKLGWGVPNSQP